MSEEPARILLVDDEESVLLTLEAVLKKEGYDVCAAGSGSEALRAIREKHFDLLLTDLRIDEVDGLTLLAAAQKRDPETVSILLTGYASLESAVQALRYGAFNYLLKPCNIDEMKLTIARGLEKKRLAEALRDRVTELEEANKTIRSFSAQLEEKVRAATAELAERVHELQESRGRLDAVIDSMQDGLVVYDRDRRALRANPFMLDLFGLAPSQVIGKSAAELAELTGEPPLEFEEPSLVLGSRAEEQSGGAVIIELEGPRKRFVRRVISPVIGDGAPLSGLVVVYQDITDQKEVEQLKDDFLSIASHELKTPLTSIMGYTQLLSRRLSHDARRSGSEDVIDVIENQCRKMKRLVEDLLDVSRIERGSLETTHTKVDLAALVDVVLSKFTGTSQQHEFEVLTPEASVTVWGDEDRLDQVLSNLVSNAIKYSPDGGKVQVRVQRNGENAEVAVRDWGIGIPEDQQARIFSRFYQGEAAVRSRRFGGMGLGLFISKAIIDEMGGTISVDSTVGKGSTFRFTLPLYRG
ncbi:MAG TPA: ATP-binding protein [Chloroflexota bacterium]|nr:ATP-binding protein [Chloroflexota bacterium]